MTTRSATCPSGSLATKPAPSSAPSGPCSRLGEWAYSSDRTSPFQRTLWTPSRPPPDPLQTSLLLGILGVHNVGN
eukprot:2956356-Pyramimonas_sp.AAC.1